MNEHAQLPESVAALFRGSGSSLQRLNPSVGWSRKAWGRLSAHQELLSGLGTRVTADELVAFASRVHDGKSALDAFIATMIWGHGRSGYGPFRTARVIDENGGADEVGEEMFRIWQLCRTEGGLAAFGDIADRRRADRSYLKHLGPAFGTKYLYFCTLAARQSGADVPLAPILDAVVARWFETNIPQVQLKIWWWDTESYLAYVSLLSDWATTLGTTVDVLEQAIFRAGDPDERSGEGTGIADRRTPDPENALHTLATSLAAAGPHLAEQARVHVDALRTLLREAGHTEDGPH